MGLLKHLNTTKYLIFKNFVTLGIHLGSLRSKTVDRRLSPFLLGHRGSYEIFYLHRTLLYFLNFMEFYNHFIRYKPYFLFATTLTHSNKVVYEYATQTQHGCVTTLWIGGILTNHVIGRFDTLSRDVIFFQDFDLNHSVPNLIFVFNLNDDNVSLLKEAKNIIVPVFGLIDSYNRIKNLDYFMPGNNDSNSIVFYYLYLFNYFLLRCFSVQKIYTHKYRTYSRYLDLFSLVGELGELRTQRQYSFELYMYFMYRYKFWVYRRPEYVDDIIAIERQSGIYRISQYENTLFNTKFLFILSFYKALFLSTQYAKVYKRSNRLYPLVVSALVNFRVVPRVTGSFLEKHPDFTQKLYFSGAELISRMGLFYSGCSLIFLNAYLNKVKFKLHFFLFMGFSFVFKKGGSTALFPYVPVRCKDGSLIDYQTKLLGSFLQVFFFLNVLKQGRQKFPFKALLPVFLHTGAPRFLDTPVSRLYMGFSNFRNLTVQNHYKNQTPFLSNVFMQSRFSLATLWSYERSHIRLHYTPNPVLEYKRASFSSITRKIFLASTKVRGS